MAKVSGLAIAFVAGTMFAVAGLQPARTIAEGFAATVELGRELARSRPEILYPVIHEGDGVVVHDPDRATPGLTLVQGLLPGGPQVRLIDNAGRELHRWNIDFFAAWEEPEHIVPRENVPRSHLNYHTQGFAVHPDGTLLANVGDKGAIFLDRCSRVIGTVDRMTHHSVTADPDGGYWLPAHNPVDRIPEHLLPPGMSREELVEATIGRFDNPENTLLKIDAQGRPETEFSVLGAIAAADLEAALHDGRANNTIDPTHLNDIEIVTDALAARIAGAEAGDLLVSLRSMNMLAIIDRQDGSLVWSKRGPWVRQHDPDITADGMIELFNNRSATAAPRPYYSEVLRYDPSSDEVTVLHPRGQADKFASFIMGIHQLLPSGNRLIAESVAGRVIEVTPAGDVVWSYVLPYGDGFAALIESAERVPEEFFTAGDWKCGSDSEIELAGRR